MEGSSKQSIAFLNVISADEEKARDVISAITHVFVEFQGNG